MNIYDFDVLDMNGNSINLGKYKGKVLLVVNTATGCGFTPQYTDLERLYEDYNDSGFEILDFPCNQFANQAPGGDSEIHTFCTGRFGITFPQFSKIEVNGENAHPMYKWLKDVSESCCMLGMLGSLMESAFPQGEKNAIKWNFTKFLVGRDGNVIARIEPNDSIKKIEKLVVEALKGDC